MKHFIDLARHTGDMIRGVNLCGIPARLSFEPWNRFFQIFRIKIERILRRIAMIDCTNR